MIVAWYSLVAPAPSGFEYHDTLSRAELRRGIFALFAASKHSACSVLQGHEEKLMGVVVTWEEQFAWEPLAKTLFHLGVPPGLRPHLGDILPVYLDLISKLHDELDADRALHLDLARALEDRRRLAADHERSRKALISDISDRRQVEAALRESEEKFRSVFETIPDVISITRLRDGLVVDLNPAISEITGVPREYFIGRSSIEMKAWANPADRELMVSTVLAQGSIRNLEAQLNSGKSQVRDCLVSAHLMQLQDEPHILTVFKDITERKRVEQALHQSEATFRKLFSESSDAILLLDSTGVFVECNQAALDLLKMDRQGFLLLPPARISPEFQPDGRRSAESAAEMIALAYSKGLHRFDWTCVNAEGGEFIVEVSLMPIVINGQTMLHTTWRDITGRKQMEAALRESEESYRTLFYSSPDPIWIIEKQRFVECNQAAVDIMGYPDEDSLKNTHPSELSPEFQPNGEASYSKAERMMLIATEKGINRFEWVHRRRDQSDFFAEVTLSALTLQGRRVLYCSWRDITERKLVEKALQESEVRFRQIFEMSPDPLIIGRADGGLINVNRAFVVNTGISAEEALGKNGLELNLWVDIGQREEFLRLLQQDGEVVNLETQFRMRDGEIRTGLTSASMIATSDGPCMLIDIRDITQQKQAEVILMEMDRTKSDFISTAAHELRTPLAVVLGYTELLRSPEDFGGFDEERKAEFLEEIFLKCETLSFIIDEMLDISRIESGLPIALNRQPHQPGAWLTKLIRRFEMQGPRHTFQLDMGGRQPEAVICDLHRISQVLENLLSNAVKYSPRGGTIAVSGETVGDDYVISVADQGIGMTPEQASHVFDKFWRADASNTAIGGLGLGMSIAKQIVVTHGGRIWVASTPGEGTKVSFSLPLQ